MEFLVARKRKIMATPLFWLVAAVVALVVFIVYYQKRKAKGNHE